MCFVELRALLSHQRPLLRKTRVLHAVCAIYTEIITARYSNFFFFFFWEKSGPDSRKTFTFVVADSADGFNVTSHDVL